MAAVGSNRVHERFGYAYDAAGNLNRRTNNALVQTFTVNNLNQLSNATRSGTLTVAGTTTSPATNVTVNLLPALRYADRTFATTNVTLLNGDNTFSAIAKDHLGRTDYHSLTVNLPATLTFLYDQNGNLRTNGSVVMAYDDENQLTAMTNAGAWASTFAYDGKMRMRISKDFAWVAGAWVQTNEVRRVYDGMLVLQERDSFNVPKLTYTRGKDLSGSLEGAGGIGGLLSFTEHGGLNLEHTYYHADGNGNITALVNSNQVVVGRNLYDPFGNPLSATGPKAGASRYRFSSKEWHPVSGMIYYGYRWYVPELQRWANIDPVEESGGFNLYAFVRNDSISSVDDFGEAPIRQGVRDGGSRGGGYRYPNGRPINVPHRPPRPENKWPGSGKRPSKCIVIKPSGGAKGTIREEILMGHWDSFYDALNPPCRPSNCSVNQPPDLGLTTPPNPRPEDPPSINPPPPPPDPFEPPRYLIIGAQR